MLSAYSYLFSIKPKSVFLGILSYSQKPRITPFRIQNKFAAVKNGKGENREREPKERKQFI